MVMSTRSSSRVPEERPDAGAAHETLMQVVTAVEASISWPTQIPPRRLLLAAARRGWAASATALAARAEICKFLEPHGILVGPSM